MRWRAVFVSPYAEAAKQRAAQAALTTECEALRKSAAKTGNAATASAAADKRCKAAEATADVAQRAMEDMAGELELSRREVEVGRCRLTQSNPS